MAPCIEAAALSLIKALSENIGKGCVPAAKATEALWSELKRKYVSFEEFTDIWFN